MEKPGPIENPRRQNALDSLRSMTGKMDVYSVQRAQLAAAKTNATPTAPPLFEYKSPLSAARNPFQVNSAQLQAVPQSQQAAEIQSLGLTVYNQQDFETGIMSQVEKAMEKEERDRCLKIVQKSMKAVQEDIESTKEALAHIDKTLQGLAPHVAAQIKNAQNQHEAVKRQQDNKLKQLQKLKAKEISLQSRLRIYSGDSSVEGGAGDGEEADSLETALGLTTRTETEAERLIRLGEMTPFGTVVNKGKSQNHSKPSTSTKISAFEQYLMDQNSKTTLGKKAVKRKKSATVSKSSTLDAASSSNDESSVKKAKLEKSKSEAELISAEKKAKVHKSSSSVKLKSASNQFDEKDKKYYAPAEKNFSNYKQRNRRFRLDHEWSGDPNISDYSGEEEGFDPDDADWRPGREDYLDEEEDGPYGTDGVPVTRKRQGKRTKPVNCDNSQGHEEFDLGKIKAEFGLKQSRATGGSSVGASRAGSGSRRTKDDGDEKSFKHRLSMLKKERLRKKQQRILKQDDPDAEISDDSDSSDSDQDMEFNGGFKVPGSTWKKLYRYQKTGVKWLWELHVQQAGGIVGDEMGLGKTIQMIAFLAGLRHSNLRDKGANTRYQGLGPTMIVCPTTVMHQWVREFHEWAPLFRVGVLHSSGSCGTSPDKLIRSMVRNSGVLVTSYSTMVNHQETLLDFDWHYVILDEGHKIRNPDAQVTLAAKQFRTCHRIILSGSPVQNNLKELWSLLDFVFPGKLGTLPDFMANFSVPIVQGGYANATEIQVYTAYKCSCVLRDTINPYLLRRIKADVQTNLQLPNKNEQVLFCRLTEEQRDVYKEYLDSKECGMILSGNYMVFPGLITLRKICNHPDLSTGGPKTFDPDFRSGSEECSYGYLQRSGKMIVIDSLLKLWHKQEHRVLLFSQSTQMLEILERFVQRRDYKYMRMDGGTSIGSRQPMITKFNNDTSYFVFLLTTRVGGLGVNLTGADRVVIFDPDWNPSTDLQARERAWRIGQKKQVTIYRLLTTGTIEEKIYHRQIFKQFLTNRVLKDPKQRRFFKSNDLFELFTLGEDDKQSTETSAIFAGTGSDVRIKTKSTSKEMDIERKTERTRRNRFDEMRERELMEDSDEETPPPQEDEEKPKEKTKKKKSKTRDETVEEGEDGDCGLSAEKIQEMKELAKKLARQFASDRNKDKPKEEAGEASGEQEKAEGAKQNDSNDESMPEGSDKHRSRRENHREKHKKKHKRKEKEKEKRKKKKRRPKDTVIDGEKINHLDRQEVKKLEEELDQEAESSKHDDYVLKNLFKKSGVIHSAMQHDKIMMSSNPDYALVEAEANRIAKQAAKALKESRARCLGARTGVPTWTGASGTGGAPPKPRFGQKKNTKLVPPDVMKSVESSAKKQPEKKPDVEQKLFDGSVVGNLRINAASASAATANVMTSSDLLTRMHSRNLAATVGESDSGDDDDEDMATFRPRRPPVIDKDNVELITDIRNYVAYQAHMDGRASTQELLDEFKRRIPSNDAAKFKAMLKQICDYDKVSGVGMWFLKQQFK